MTIELDKQARTMAVASIERYYNEHFDEKIGNIQAAALLHFFMEEIAPAVYNQAVAAVQERLIARVTEVDIECHEDEFTYWQKQRRR